MPVNSKPNLKQRLGNIASGVVRAAYPHVAPHITPMVDFMLDTGNFIISAYRNTGKVITSAYRSGDFGITMLLNSGQAFLANLFSSFFSQPSSPTASVTQPSIGTYARIAAIVPPGPDVAAANDLAPGASATTVTGTKVTPVKVVVEEQPETPIEQIGIEEIETDTDTSNAPTSTFSV